jgi:hypothetical protein
VVILEAHRDLTALEPQVDRPGDVGDERQRHPDLRRVCHVDHGHVRDRAHQGDVLDRLVAGPAGAGHAGHEAHDPHREVRVGDGVDDLVERPPCRENAEGVHEREEAAPGKRPCHADHVGLGHARVDEAFRYLLLEQVDLCLAGEVPGQAQDLGALARQLDERAAVGLHDGRVGLLKQDGPPVP